MGEVLCGRRSTWVKVYVGEGLRGQNAMQSVATDRLIQLRMCSSRSIH